MLILTMGVLLFQCNKLPGVSVCKNKEKRVMNLPLSAFQDCECSRAGPARLFVLQLKGLGVLLLFARAAQRFLH